LIAIALPIASVSPLSLRERGPISGLFKIWVQLDILIAIALPITSVSPLSLREKGPIFGLFKI
jgi:hypothetical protein